MNTKTIKGRGSEIEKFTVFVERISGRKATVLVDTPDHSPTHASISVGKFTELFGAKPTEGEWKGIHAMRRPDGSIELIYDRCPDWNYRQFKPMLRAAKKSILEDFKPVLRRK